ncbi:methyl-accepting chemotaxis protein [Anaerocolumna sp.]|uniref:methyl-accepting chemotaxis protein n=1 Tax=Anaerocolumna sp. TaxID=2041569 RepID=UPI0028A600CC|nr:methyl-accepting chemotaxis protein [Anaerocolumna sp.]
MRKVLKNSKYIDPSDKDCDGDDRKSENRISKIGTYFFSIRFKLIASFLVPIAFIILLGIVSFRVAADSIVRNYETATLQSIDMASEYLRFGLEAAENTAVQYMRDDTITKHFLNLYSSDALEYRNREDRIFNQLKTKKKTDEFIGNIYILSDLVPSIATVSDLQGNLYGGFIKTDLGTYLKTNKTKHAWIGENEYLDSNLGTSDSPYSMRYVRNFTSAEALMVIDISKDTVDRILENLKIDKTGFVGVVTEDGREITLNDNEDSLFYGEAFYQAAVTAKEDTGAEYVDYHGQDYLFMYSKIGNTDIVICSLIPKKTITSQADNIKLITYVIVFIACLIAVLTCFGISMGIDKTIKEIIVGLKKAAKGDLTVSFHSRSRDEFHLLISEIQNTFLNMKSLIMQAKELSGEVSNSSIDVTKTSGMFFKSTEDITSAILEIEQGISQQAKEAEQCLTQMDQLSQRIALVSNNTREIAEIADKTIHNTKDGAVVTEHLNQQTKTTIEITTDIINKIEKLAEKSSTINNIVNVINEIADQTNLLSLNASIEAARAGNYGRGFSVVANEIRKLAEQSQKSVNDIKDIISSIQDDTKNAVQITLEAEKALKLQDGAVKNTMKSFHNISDSVEDLMTYLNHIADNVGNMEDARVSTTEAISNISAVMEEIAASTNTVNQNSNLQLSSVETLNNSAGNLNENAKQLVEAVYKFQI